VDAVLEAVDDGVQADVGDFAAVDAGVHGWQTSV
jgi:hypothetical protein